MGEGSRRAGGPGGTRGTRGSVLAAALTAAVALLGTSCAAGTGAGAGPETSMASCVKMVEVKGRRYVGTGEVVQALPLTERTVPAVLPGCNDLGGQDPEPDERIEVTVIRGVPVEQAVAWQGELLVAEGADVPRVLLDRFTRRRCPADVPFEVSGRWLAVHTRSEPRYDGDLRAPLRVELRVAAGTGAGRGLVGARIWVRDPGSARPALTRRDARRALWSSGTLSVRVHCEDGRYVADAFRSTRCPPAATVRQGVVDEVVAGRR